MRTQRLRRLATALILPIALVTSCGDDSSGPDPASHPAALNVSGDFDVTDFGSESSNLMFALQEAGFPLDTSTVIDSTGLAALLGDKDLFFIPEVTLSFDAPAQAFLKQWVEAGGTIVLVGGYRNTTFLNAIFAASMTTTDGFSDRDGMPKAGGADGTPFESGPAFIPGNNGGNCLTVATLPVGAKVIYLGEAPSVNASVVVFPLGSGQIIYFGWDWYDGRPYGIQDGGWRELLKLTASF